jgi:spore germination cell wall hydrolase CwlJ-like protein
MNTLNVVKNIELLDDREILARTLYGEARGEYIPPWGRTGENTPGNIDGLVAVGNVVMNRLHQQTWYGKNVRAVCLKPYQFSCWNQNDPNRKEIMMVDSKNPIFKICLEVASALCSLTCSDLTYGSDHYFSTSLNHPPKWAEFAEEKVTIGRHRFFKMHQK